MEEIIEYLPFLIPIFILQLGLAIFSLVHVLKHDNYRFGNKLMWAIIVMCFQFIGPVVYFVFGRGDE